MKHLRWQIILILAALAVFFTFPYFNSAKIPGEGFSTIGSDTVRAEVTKILEEGQVDMSGHMQKYQVVRVNILTGEYAGVPMQIDYGKRQVRSDEYDLKVGDKVMVSISKTPTECGQCLFCGFCPHHANFMAGNYFCNIHYCHQRLEGCGRAGEHGVQFVCHYQLHYSPHFGG